MSCQTCSSELPPPQIKYAFITPWCQSPICQTCITQNPRLRDYIPCLKCGDPRSDQLRGGGGGSRALSSIAQSQSQAAIRGSEGEGEEVLFEIGDDEDENEGELPPSYDDISVRESESQDRSSDAQDQHQNQSETPSFQDADPVEEEQYETVEIKHRIMKGDSVLSIARKYATDPHDILSLNNLPFTALNTNQRIIQTRKEIVISRRRILSSKLTNTHPTPPNQPSHEEEEVDEEREKQKALKRFQILTKNSDLGIANTYLNLSKLEEESQNNKDNWQGEGGETIDGKKKKSTMISKDNREQRALESFFDDSQWESQNPISKLDVNRNMGGRWNNFVGNSISEIAGIKL